MSIKISKAQVRKLSTMSTKSGKIRYLNSIGFSRGQIQKYLTDNGFPTIYQHVRNVLITPVQNPKDNIK